MDLSDEAIFACADSVRLAGTGALAGLMRHIRDAATAAERQRCIRLVEQRWLPSLVIAALRGGEG